MNGRTATFFRTQINDWEAKRAATKVNEQYENKTTFTRTAATDMFSGEKRGLVLCKRIPHSRELLHRMFAKSKLLKELQESEAIARKITLSAIWTDENSTEIHLPGANAMHGLTILVSQSTLFF